MEFENQGISLTELSITLMVLRSRYIHLQFIPDTKQSETTLTINLLLLSVTFAFVAIRVIIISD